MITVGPKWIRAAATSAAGLLLVGVLASCGEDGSIDLPSPSGSITASLPSPTRSLSRSPSQPPSESPSRTASPTESEPESESPTESEAPTEAPTETPTESESAEATSAAPTQSPLESASSSEPTEPAASSSAPAADGADAAEPEEDQGLPSWWWWVLAGLGLLGATLAVILVPRARRRGSWDTVLAVQQEEVAWFARELLPGLQQAVSPDAVAGGWQVAAARVTRAEDQLTGLESTAPDDARRSRARSLRDAVRTARQDIETLIVSRDPAALPRDLAAIENQLQTALDPSETTG